MKLKGLKVPSLLVKLVNEGFWVKGSELDIKKHYEFLNDPLTFLQSFQGMKSTPSFKYDEVLRIYSSSEVGLNRNLPWLDIDNSIFIAINKNPGDDIAIALDYRDNSTSPIVVASKWTEVNGYCEWVKIENTFDDLVQTLKMNVA